MNWIARIIGAVLGFMAAGPLGLLIGFAAGYYFDRARAKFRHAFSPEQRQKVERALFNSVFPLLGYMAKADGRVSEEEIEAAEQLMTRMQLAPESRQQAIALFKQGVAAEFSLDQTMDEFVAICGVYADIKQMLLVYLVAMALSDGELHPAETDILRQVARKLGYSDFAFEHLLRMAQAQSRFQQGQQPQRSAQDDLKTAYEALGVDADVSDAELKRAYRKLMSQYHPDKLVGQGVPEEMIKVATERSQEIQTAYDLIKKHRQNS